MNRRKPRHWPGTKDDQTWQEWKDAIWTSMAERFGYPGLAPLEQYMHRSAYEQRCIECGEPGVVEQHSQIVLSVDVYWFCQACSDYWADRAARERASAPPRRQRKLTATAQLPLLVVAS